ncbi:carboxypeptidase 2 [Amylocarpus encephaloides]|uniref:Carboxypeptidase 2 n=1 Tax=Amylocarpus encephaloides TaxID=45428 RepID=A0A9P8C9T0_9HELO|nr:carboxypeptidase 2 [Amylocarpus encephaloides]
MWGPSEAIPTNIDNNCERQVPTSPTGVKTLVTPQNITIRYKEPRICETTPGVNSYAGYIDLDADSHTFFWFFEARHNPKDAPITLWLNGGPGADSMIGLFDELGPCSINEDLETVLNPYSWNEVTNLLFISQPLGVGFSYSTEGLGTLDPFTMLLQETWPTNAKGRYPVVDASLISTTEQAAVAAWHIVQGFFGGLPQLDAKVKTKEFHLWTESYVFFNYFSQQNEMISTCKLQGTKLNFGTLGLISPIIDAAVQYPQHPEFAIHNTYGIKAYNETGGCLDRISKCRQTSMSTPADYAICADATNFCDNNVANVYMDIGNRDAQDIRIQLLQDHYAGHHWIDYLNLASTQNAIGVDLNYTHPIARAVSRAFGNTGELSFPNFRQTLEKLLTENVRVAMVFGDADYLCNWYGGEAVSLALDYPHKKDFAKAGYAPFHIDGEEYGEVRQYSNFSFLRVYESGHKVPSYQPKASLEMFRRTLQGVDVAEGKIKICDHYSTSGKKT